MESNSWIEKLVHRAGSRAKQKLAKEPNYDFLRRHALFQELDAPAFVYFYKHLVERRYSRHEMIFKEGNPGICLFIVKKGRVEIFTQDEELSPSNRVVYTMLTEGALFGELSLIALAYRNSSARALEHGTEMLTLSIYDLEIICEQFPRDGIRLMKIMAATLGNHLVAMDHRLAQVLDEVETLKQKLAQHE